MAAEVANSKWISFHLLSPLLEIMKKFIGNQPSNIESFLFPTPTIVDGDDLVADDDRAAAVSGQGADGVGDFGVVWFEGDNAVGAGHSVLVQDESCAVFVEWGVVLTAAWVPEYLQLLFISALLQTLGTGNRQGRIRINLPVLILFFWVLLQLDEGVVELQPLDVILACPEFKRDPIGFGFVEGLGGAIGADVEFEPVIIAFLNFVIDVMRCCQEQILGNANATSDSSLFPLRQEGHPTNAAVRDGGEDVWLRDGEKLLLVDELLLLEVRGRAGVSH